MMRIIVETARRWRLPLVCCAWMFTMLGLLMRRGYETFLAANFLPVIVLAVIALLPMGLFALLRRATPRFGVREALGTAIILLPLVYIQHSKGTTLGSGAFAARFVGTGIAAGESAPAGRGAAGGEVSLLDLFMDTEKYDGQKIVVMGMLTKDNPQVEQILGEKLPVVFRFAINCCAADAMPLALILEGGDTGSLKNDEWIEASGTFRSRDTGKMELLILEDAKIRPAEAPEQPYLYPKWGMF